MTDTCTAVTHCSNQIRISLLHVVAVLICAENGQGGLAHPFQSIFETFLTNNESLFPTKTKIFDTERATENNTQHTKV